MVAPVHRPLGESATSRHRQFANFLSVASSILGGAILQVFLSPPAAVTADSGTDLAAFGWCASLHSCAAWQRSWQISCVIAFCFVILSIIACATASIANKTSMSLAAAILFFFASFFATAAAVLSVVFLSFPKATCITTAALLVSLLLTSVLFGREGLVMGLDDVVLAPWLWRAAAAGDAAAVRRLLRWGASPTWGGHVPRGPAHDGDTTAYFLSDTGAIHGVTPLHIAACHGHLEVARELLRDSPDIKLAARDSLGSTALHVAAHSLKDHMVELLISSSADCWAVNNGGWTPLLAAMESGMPINPHPKALQSDKDVWEYYLEELKLDTSPDSRNNEREQIAGQLLTFRSNSAIDRISPKSNFTALQLAIKREWTSMAYSLIDAGASADVPDTCEATLALACIRGGHDWDMVGRLVNAGASIDWQDREGDTALHVCFNLLIAAESELEVDDVVGWLRNKPFRITLCAMDLLMDGANVDTKNKYLETPLMRAAAVPDPVGRMLTSLLLLYSPNLDATDDQGWTALHAAINAANPSSVALLLAAGANPNPPMPHVIALTKEHLTPLQLAVVTGCGRAAKRLIKHGANVNAFPAVLPNEKQLRKEADGLVPTFRYFIQRGHIYTKMPPLMHAIHEGRADMVKLLLDRGADISQTGNTKFRSALEAAIYVEEWRIVRMLRRRMRKAANARGRWAGWRTRHVRLADNFQYEAAGQQGTDQEGAQPPPEQPEQPEQAAQHQVIEIHGEQQEQKTQAQAGVRPQPASRFSLLARLAQMAGWLMQPFRRSSSGEPSPPLSPQPSQHLCTPLSQSASGSDGSPFK